MNIALLLSGGVDSAVATHLLMERGLRPDLFYIKIGMDGDDELTCTAEEDIELCQAMARRYGLPLEVIDLQKSTGIAWSATPWITCVAALRPIPT